MRDRGTAMSVSEAVDLPISQIGIKLVGTNFIIGEGAETKIGVRGLAPRNIFQNHAFQIF